MKIIEKLVSTIISWPKIYSFFAGFIAALAFPPFNAVPVLFAAFPLLFLLLHKAQNGKQAFVLGWLFSFGHLIVCLHWIAASLFVEIAAFWFILPLAVCGLPAILALFYGIATTVAYRLGLSRIDGVFILGFCWFLADLARAHLFTGLPWDILGYVWSDYLPMVQSVSLWGIDGLTGITIMFVLLPALFFFPDQKKIARFITFFGGLLFVALFVWGAQRVGGADLKMVPDVKLRLVQPDQVQALKWRPEQRLANLNTLLEASFKADDTDITHYIWPETATSYYLSETTGIRNYIAKHIPKNKFVITGVVRRQVGQDDEKMRYYNSLIALNDRGDIIAGYDKHHLVPFGEYFPLRSLIPFRVITALGVDFTEGDGVRSMRVPRLPGFGALVCYEAIFSGQVASTDDPPHFLINVTNDAWYEGTIGISQHFAMSKMRAIEEGMPLVRVANKGVTGVVDPWGRLVGDRYINGVGYIDVSLPQESVLPSYFNKQYDKMLWLISLISFFLALILCLRHSKA